MKYICIILIIMCSTFSTAQSTYPKIHIDEITIQYVDFDMETFSDVSCESFLKMFDGSIKNKIFKDKESILKIQDEISRLQSGGRKYKRAPDVRIKLYAYYKHKIIYSMCSGNGMTRINGTSYVNDKPFSDFLRWLSDSPPLSPK